MHEHPTSSEASSELWQAWRYVAGEMDPPECSRFEEQLAVDQAAREAVAEALDLNQLVRVAESETVALPAGSTGVAARQADWQLRRWSRRLGWLAAGAAASLLAVAAFNLRRPESSPADPSSAAAPASSADRSELALAWTETRSRWLDESGSASGLDGAGLDGAGQGGLLGPSEPNASDSWSSDSWSSDSGAGEFASRLPVSEQESATALEPAIDDMAAPDWMVTALELAAQGSEAPDSPSDEEI